MRVTKTKISQVLSIGDTVYVILPRGGYCEAKVLWIGYDSLDTDVDVLFYDEIGENWYLHESTAKKITQESQKNVL